MRRSHCPEVWLYEAEFSPEMGAEQAILHAEQAGKPEFSRVVPAVRQHKASRWAAELTIAMSGRIALELSSN